MQRSVRSFVSSSNLARVSVRSRCLGPFWSAVMNGRLTVGLHHARELDLRLLSRFGEALHGLLVAGEVDALIFAELGHEIVDDALVVVVAAEVRVAVGRFDFEDAVADFEDRHVERAAAEVPHEDRLVVLLVEAVGERRRRRLVDDAQHVEAGDLAGVLRGLALRVVEVRRHGDDRFGHPLAEVVRRVVDELLEDHRRDLLRRVVLPVDLDFEVRPHVPLDRRDRAVGIGDGLTFCELAHEPLAGLGEGHDRGSRPAPLGVRDDDGRAALHHGDDGIRRAQVDTDHFCHLVSSLNFPSAVDQPRGALPLTGAQGYGVPPKEAL